MKKMVILVEGKKNSGKSSLIHGFIRHNNPETPPYSDSTEATQTDVHHTINHTLPNTTKKILLAVVDRQSNNNELRLPQTFESARRIILLPFDPTDANEANSSIDDMKTRIMNHQKLDSKATIIVVATKRDERLPVNQTLMTSMHILADNNGVTLAENDSADDKSTALLFDFAIHASINDNHQMTFNEFKSAIQEEENRFIIKNLALEINDYEKNLNVDSTIVDYKNALLKTINQYTTMASPNKSMRAAFRTRIVDSLQYLVNNTLNRTASIDAVSAEITALNELRKNLKIIQGSAGFFLHREKTAATDIDQLIHTLEVKKEKMTIDKQVDALLEAQPQALSKDNVAEVIAILKWYATHPENDLNEEKPQMLINQWLAPVSDDETIQAMHTAIKGLSPEEKAALKDFVSDVSLRDNPEHTAIIELANVSANSDTFKKSPLIQLLRSSRSGKQNHDTATYLGWVKKANAIQPSHRP